jgi:hypothetical protein
VARDDALGAAHERGDPVERRQVGLGRAGLRDERDLHLAQVVAGEQEQMLLGEERRAVGAWPPASTVSNSPSGSATTRSRSGCAARSTYSSASLSRSSASVASGSSRSRASVDGPGMQLEVGRTRPGEDVVEVRVGG